MVKVLRHGNVLGNVPVEQVATRIDRRSVEARHYTGEHTGGESDYSYSCKSVEGMALYWRTYLLSRRAV